MFSRSLKHNKITIVRVARRILCIFLAVCVLSNTGICAFADIFSDMQQQEAETQNAISNLEKQTAETKSAIDALEKQKAESEKNVNNLQSQSASLKNEYNNYSNQLTSINNEIADTEEKMAKTSGEIVALNNELMENQRLERDLYDKLKKQIRVAYEKSLNNSLILTLLQSKSFRDFLNRAEYVSAIVAYQQKLLKQYREVEAQIEAQTEVLEAKQDEMDAYQNELDGKHSDLQNLAYNVAGELKDTNNSLSSERDKMAGYEADLKKLDEQMKALESQVAAAQAKLAQQIAARLAAQEAEGRKEDTSGNYYASDSELVWLAATIQAEADGESYTGKLAVGSVIMNRVMSSSFPNSIQGVITQNMQFASYRSGKVELIISRGPNSTCMQAAQEVLNGARVGDYLFFMTKKYADYYRIADYTMIGNHAFFYKWVTKDKEAKVEETNTEESKTEENADNSESANKENASENAPENSDMQTQEGNLENVAPEATQQTEENPDTGSTE